MHEVMRKRLWRKLESLPEDQLYQVLDFIEFLEAKYAPGRTPDPSGLQRFAERLEDRMRVRAIAPAAMAGTMKVIGTAGRMLDGLTEAGRELLGEPGARPGRPPRRAPAKPVASEADSAT